MKSQSHPKPLELWARRVTLNGAAEVDPSTDLEVNVIFTDDEGTLAALKAAGVLAHNLRPRINLLVFQTVPLAFPLTRPPVSIPFTEQRLLHLVSQNAQGSLHTAVYLYLCRDEKPALRQMLRPQSLVVIGSRRRWWRTKEQRLAERLRHDGHQVFLAYLQ